MAIDTAEKRRSAASFRRLPGVTPNAGKDQEWRQQAARRYSGILADEADVVATLVDRWANVLTVDIEPIPRLVLSIEERR
jgi:hypothetical protein